MKTITIILFNIQKFLYCAMILTQLFEWKMYIVFINFQSSNKPEELIGLKKKYNRREKLYFYGFLLIILVFGCLTYSIDKLVGLYSHNKCPDVDEKTHPKDKATCDNYQRCAYIIYVFVYSFLAGCIILSSLVYRRLLQRREIGQFEEHIGEIRRYSVFLLASIGIKLFLTSQLFEYKTILALPIYSISELVALTLFCLFKRNSDCFQCFNRSQEITYSIFQITLKNRSNFDTELESSEANENNMLYSSMNSTEDQHSHHSYGGHSRNKNLKRRTKSVAKDDPDQSRNSAYYEQALLTRNSLLKQTITSQSSNNELKVSNKNFNTANFKPEASLLNTEELEQDPLQQMTTAVERGSGMTIDPMERDSYAYVQKYEAVKKREEEVFDCN